MNSRRDYHSNRTALFDGIEEGGVRAYSSHEIDEHDNDLAMEGLQDRVNILKRLTGDIHEEVESHNRMLDRMVRSLHVCGHVPIHQCLGCLVMVSVHEHCSDIRAMIWIHQGASCLEQWIASRWVLRRSRVVEWLPWWHLLWPSSYSFIS
ncbi:uncharacterized protein LOC135617479 isoform X1 [Musa acuminata AAA Group]|uniref:uncharacterized protein LOC135617479 isoform X1 n=1 Tax=Musa acuminata AAA Group TaxID=214697 RepID=UPI0031D9C2A6